MVAKDRHGRYKNSRSSNNIPYNNLTFWDFVDPVFSEQARRSFFFFFLFPQLVMCVLSFSPVKLERHRLFIDAAEKRVLNVYVRNTIY